MLENKELAPIMQLATMDHNKIATTIIDGVTNGEIDPMNIHMFLKRIEKISETVLKDEGVKQVTLTSARNHIVKGSSFDYTGATLTVQAVSTTYDFSACGDPVWDNLNELSKTIAAHKKDRETFLKAAFPEKTTSLYGSANPTVVVDTLLTLVPADCGEEVTLMRPIKYQKEGIKTMFKKV